MASKQAGHGGFGYSEDDEETLRDNGEYVLTVRVERPRGIVGMYRHPYAQVVMLGFVCFMGPGLFNALNGLGGGGQLDSQTSANANTAVYSAFAFFAFFAGTINNKLGSRLTLTLGSLGYSLYISSYLVFNMFPSAGAFVIVSGCVLGLCAGLLWTAQGSLMLSYCTEDQKGTFIGLFWAIFNLGGVVGAGIAAAINHKNQTNSVGDGTYIGFLVLTAIGTFIPLFMTDPHKMVRSDGSRVQTHSRAVVRHPSWKIEFYSLWVALVTDPMILLLFPMFFASNYFYTWQFNDYNGALFNIRTRSINDVVYWFSQIIGSISIGILLDTRKLSRRTRAFVGWGILLSLVLVVHAWAYVYQRGYVRTETEDKMDFTDPGYAAHLWLYIFCALMDAMWQTTAYWMMGAMSNDPAKLAHFTGFYKSIQSAGGAIGWRIDAMKVPYMNIFLSTWALLVGGLVFALPMLYLRVKNTTDYEDEALVRMDDSGNLRPASQYEPSYPMSDQSKLDKLREL
ncbi:MFS general substrate transporter [Exidia glandulosa HHB12029]|uniref:MFS general substrate transporter n=1 Tax=Exidia glandulosa HHB12029 TaxID=1314781 RepID=A0A165NGX1_EXIGL|nr:MFS general substrate transporter [Exidia glandulosa HHB12029]